MARNKAEGGYNIMTPGNDKDLSADLQSLGETVTKYSYDKPEPKLLERFANPFSIKEINSNNVKGTLNIVVPEFTSLCPKTGQPDFATIVIDYEPGVWCVESKSLKLYLGSYRMNGEFHESCINRICNDLVDLLQPKWLTVVGQFTPRGGIPFWPTAQYGQPDFEIQPTTTLEQAG